jgi:hypothetical protein
MTGRPESVPNGFRLAEPSFEPDDASTVVAQSGVGDARDRESRDAGRDREEGDPLRRGRTESRLAPCSSDRMAKRRPESGDKDECAERRDDERDLVEGLDRFGSEALVGTLCQEERREALATRGEPSDECERPRGGGCERDSARRDLRSLPLGRAASSAWQTEWQRHLIV